MFHAPGVPISCPFCMELHKVYDILASINDTAELYSVWNCARSAKSLWQLTSHPDGVTVLRGSNEQQASKALSCCSFPLFWKKSSNTNPCLLAVHWEERKINRNPCGNRRRSQTADRLINVEGVRRCSRSELQSAVPLAGTKACETDAP